MQRFTQRTVWLSSLAQGVYRLIQPRVTVGAVGVLFNADGHVLLVEHVFHPRHPWGLPGGWTDRNEIPSDTVIREFHEETNLQVDLVMPIAVWNNNFWRNHLDLAFLLKSADGNYDEIMLSAELLDFQWAALDQLPSLMSEQYQIIRRAKQLHDLVCEGKIE